MEEIVVTRLWMGGVVLMMLAFAVIAVIGHYRRKSRTDPEQSSQPTEN